MLAHKKCTLGLFRPIGWMCFVREAPKMITMARTRSMAIAKYHHERGKLDKHYVAKSHLPKDVTCRKVYVEVIGK